MNKKIIVLFLAAVVFTSAGSFGTYAYFNHKVTLSENINLKMGKVEINAKWNGNWICKDKEVKPKDNGKTLNYENVKKNSVFEREIKVESVGSLKSNLHVDVKNSDIKEKLKVEIVQKSITTTSGELENGNKHFFRINNFSSGAVSTFKIRVTVKDASQDINNMKINDFVNIYAEQLK